MKDDVKLARWMSGEMEEQELREFMASPEFDTYNKIKEYSAQLIAPEADMDALYTRIQGKRDTERQNDNVKVRRLNPWLPRIAAALVVLLGGTFFLYTSKTTTQTAANGKRAEFLLPDNSAVVLNSGSEAEYRTWNWQGNRTIELDGEAYFKVAKGETFDVVTDLGTVTVVGTQFNVKERDNRLDVTCFEGKVKVTAGKESILLTPGKSVTFTKGKLEEFTDQGMQPGWITYEADFVNEMPKDVLREMERQYNVTFEVEGSFTEKPFTGTIPMNDMDIALDIIKTVYQLKSEKKGNTIILSSE